MAYQPKDFDRLLGTPGFSDNLLKNHFALYKGYVQNVNKMVDEMTALMKEGKTSSLAYMEIKRRFPFEFNGMKLHEVYFENMINKGARLEPHSPLAARMKEDFGSVDAWEKSFRAVGSMRGVGWALLCYDAEGDSLYNVWIDEHHVNWPARTVPVLLMDVWEHAFMLDYGVKRDGYIEAFLKAANWKTAGARFAAASRELALRAFP
jgi:superoxide dismutase, Fe-Mn family